MEVYMRAQISPYQTIRSIILDCAKNTKTARNKLMRASETDADLHSYFLKLGIDQAIRHFFSDERRVKFIPPKSNWMPRDETRIQVKLERRLFWERYSLFGQIELAKATKEQLLISASERRRQADGNIACANFESELAKGIKDDLKTVADVFTATKVMELARQHRVIPNETT
jgi:hypothetical protein